MDYEDTFHGKFYETNFDVVDVGVLSSAKVKELELGNKTKMPYFFIGGIIYIYWIIYLIQKINIIRT